MSSHSPIDPEAIENLRQLSPEDGESFLRDIVGIFVEDTPARIAELKKALAEGDQPTFTRAAHSIKGSSSNLGAIQLRAVAEKLEHTSRSQGLAGLEVHVPELENAFAQAKGALEQILTV